MSTENKGQQITITLKSEKERDLIIANFKENEVLLKAIRAVLLNLSVTDEDRAKIRALSPEIKQILRDRINPQLDRESAIGVLADNWLSLDKDIKGQAPFTVEQAIQSNIIALELTEIALALLDNPDLPSVDLKYDPKVVTDEWRARLLGRNRFIRNINEQIFLVSLIANTPIETPQQTAKRVRKDSAA